MYAGALLNSRVSRVVYGAYDQRLGACHSYFNILSKTLLIEKLKKKGRS